MQTYLRAVGVIILLGLITSCGSNRSLGSKIDDSLLIPNVFNQIESSDPAFKDANNRVVVSSYRGTVLLTGQVASSDLRQKAEQAAIKVATVKKLHNHLEISAPIKNLTKINDSAITSQIKARFLADSRLPSADIKVITENSTVYLMGVINRTQAQIALETARTIAGVSKIIVLFDYHNEEE